jgi:hypothetical protein
MGAPQKENIAKTAFGHWLLAKSKTLPLMNTDQRGSEA